MSGNGGNINPFSQNPRGANEHGPRSKPPFRRMPPLLENSKKSILLVYPEKDITSVYSQQLSCFVKGGAGGVIRVAGSFRDAMEAVLRNHFDVAVVGEEILRTPVSEIVGDKEQCGRELAQAICWYSPLTCVVLETKTHYYIYRSGHHPYPIEKAKFQDPEIAFQHAVALALHLPR